MFASNTSQVANDAVFVEDIFSTTLYTGNGSTQTITNGIDLAGKGGLTWIKNRSDTGGHRLFDTARGVYNWLSSNSTGAQQDASPYGVTAFNSNGFAVSDSGPYAVNDSGQTYASWTFREQAKFFDVVTYTGDGNLGRTVAHSLGSVPGCIIIKNTGTGGTNWGVYHRSVGATGALFLNQTYGVDTSSSYWNNTEPTSTVFTVGNQDWNNQSGQTYVAYLFAHDAGGFGLTGTDNVISCGSYYNSGSAPVNVNLGYEPQWILIKNADSAQNWFLMDTMRGDSLTSQAILKPNTSDAETVNAGAPGYPAPTATGFTTFLGAAGTFIYIAIRRGPMKVPTSGTSVFSPNAVTMTASGSATITTNFPVDLSFNRKRSTADQYVMDRLRGGSQTSYNYLRTQTTGAETTGSTIGVGFDSNTSLVDNNWLSGVSANTIWWSFRRAPSFFDEVCYTGTGSARTVTHNLGVAPEMMIVKVRDSATDWAVYHSGIGATKRLILNLTDTPYTSATAGWNDTAPTASVFTVGTNVNVNGNGYLYVAYLFATCAGVSKCFSYTGNGSSQTINCGFTGGARWILIKRTDSTGDWYVWDSARGIVSGNDPHLSLNSTAAEVTTDDTIDTDSTGFVVNQVSATNVNVSSATYIGFAIA